jgi:hypothetical protein
MNLNIEKQDGPDGHIYLIKDGDTVLAKTTGHPQQAAHALLFASAPFMLRALYRFEAFDHHEQTSTLLESRRDNGTALEPIEQAYLDSIAMVKLLATTFPETPPAS